MGVYSLGVYHSRTTDLGSGHARTCHLEVYSVGIYSTGVYKVGVYSLGVYHSRTTDFWIRTRTYLLPGSPQCGSLQHGSLQGGSLSWESTILAPPIWDQDTHLPVHKKNYTLTAKDHKQ